MGLDCKGLPIKLLKLQWEILENANFSLIALKANVPPSLQMAAQSHTP